MKKLIIASMLVIGLIATAQSLQSNHLDLRNNPMCESYCNDLDENLISEINEEDAPFDFNTKDYLPVGFNPYATDRYGEIFEVSLEEEDTPFDFDTKEYLPVGFNPYATDQYEDLSEISIEEEDEQFDFNTKNYLPKNFDPYAV